MLILKLCRLRHIYNIQGNVCVMKYLLAGAGRLQRYHRSEYRDITKIIVYRCINLVGGERGKSIGCRPALCNFRCNGSNLDVQLCRFNGGRALVNPNVDDVSVVEWCCIQTQCIQQGYVP
jgi:hypothetical protein